MDGADAKELVAKLAARLAALEADYAKLKAANEALASRTEALADGANMPTQLKGLVEAERLKGDFEQYFLSFEDKPLFL